MQAPEQAFNMEDSGMFHNLCIAGKTAFWNRLYNALCLDKLNAQLKLGPTFCTQGN